MSDIRTDIMENLQSARDPLTAEDLYLDAITWPLANGGRRRAELTQAEVNGVLAELVVEGKIVFSGGGFRIWRDVAKEETQLQLF